MKAGSWHERIPAPELDIQRVTEIVRIVKAEISMMRIAHIDADEAKLLGG